MIIVPILWACIVPESVKMHQEALSLLSSQWPRYGETLTY